MSSPSSDDERDVIVAGAGINGLVCALTLARAGLSVEVIEDWPAVGGMHRAEFPFAAAPRLMAYTGAHRIGFLSPELERHLGVDLRVTPRSPAMFVPTVRPGSYLLAGARADGGAPPIEGPLLSDRDRAAADALFRELDLITADLAPAWSAGAMAVEEIAERWVRRELRDAFVALCRGSFAEHVARFGIASGAFKAALALDALGGSFASWDTPGSGGPLLLRHAASCAAGGGDGIVAGGLGALARVLADAAQAAGARISTAAAVTKIEVQGNAVTGVVLASGERRRGGAVVSSADPWRLRALVGADHFPPEHARRIDAYMRPGSIAKLNVAFADLPRFTCLPEDRGQHRAAIFLLDPSASGDDDAVRTLGRAFSKASGGGLPAHPPVECVFSSAPDPALRDPDGRHSASLLVPWAPYDIAGSTWAAEEERFGAAVLDVLEAYAPGARALAVEVVLHHPKRIESDFGVTRGHLTHVDDTVLFGDRLPAATPISGLYACGPGCAPAAAAIGMQGLVAARRVIRDFEIALERTEVGLHSDP
jgi:phytoene dehydrogenase-like protein